MEQLISPEKYARLPFSVRVLLESAVRNCDNFQVSESDVQSIVDWEKNQGQGVEIRFRPARVILQDFTGSFPNSFETILFVSIETFDFTLFCSSFRSIDCNLGLKDGQKSPKLIVSIKELYLEKFQFE